MRIYLAARFGRRDELREISSVLRRRGFTIASSWLEQTEDAIDSHDGPQLAELDLFEIKGCDVFVAFTDAPGTPGAERGGRQVEFGAAAAYDRSIVLVGPIEHIFHRLPGVARVETTTQLLRWLEHVATVDVEQPAGPA